jgi:hypothetical protein
LKRFSILGKTSSAFPQGNSTFFMPFYLIL